MVLIHLRTSAESSLLKSFGNA